MAVSVASMPMAFGFWGLAYRLGSEIDGFLYIYLMILAALFGFFLCAIGVVSIVQVFRPFFQDLDDLSRKPLLLEFQYAGMALISPYPFRMLIGFFFDRIIVRVSIYDVFHTILALSS